MKAGSVSLAPQPQTQHPPPRCLVAMETPLLLKPLIFTLCLRALCFRSRIPPPYSQPVWEGVLLGGHWASLSLNQSQGCDQKTEEQSHGWCLTKKFSCPFLLQLHTRRWGGQVLWFFTFYKWNIDSFIQSAGQQTHISHFFVHDWALRIQETNLILAFKIVHSWTVFFIVSWKDKVLGFSIKNAI